MQEHPYDREEVAKRLAGRPTIELHGLDGEHHQIAPLPRYDRDGWSLPPQRATQPMPHSVRAKRKQERQNRRAGRKAARRNG